MKVWVHKGMDAPLLGFELVGDDNPKTVWPLADGRASRVLRILIGLHIHFGVRSNRVHTHGLPLTLSYSLRPRGRRGPLPQVEVVHLLTGSVRSRSLGRGYQPLAHERFLALAGLGAASSLAQRLRRKLLELVVKIVRRGQADQGVVMPGGEGQAIEDVVIFHALVRGCFLMGARGCPLGRDFFPGRVPTHVARRAPRGLRPRRSHASRVFLQIFGPLPAFDLSAGLALGVDLGGGLAGSVCLL